MKAITTIAALGVSLLMLSGCGNGNNNPATAGAQQFVPGGVNCSYGQVYTQYGCLPQGNCQYGMAQYNNTCIQAIQNNYNNPYNNPYQQQQCSYGQIYTQYGCLPQGNCQVGMAQYNNTCIPAQNNPYNNPYNNQYNNQYNTGFNYQFNWGYNTGSNTGYNNCQAGYLSTNYGCQPQANCGTGRVLFQNICRNVYQNTYGGSYQFIIQM